MKKNKKNQYLAKNTFLFAIGNFGSKLISFLLVPIYTNILSTSGYGVLDIINVILTIGLPIITLNISESILRFLLDKDSNKDNILQICYYFSIISIIFSFMLIPIFNLIPEISTHSILIAIYLASSAISGIAMCYIRGVEKIKSYAIISIIKTSFIGILSIVFLVLLHMTIDGYLLAYILSEILAIILCFIFGVSDKKVKLSKPDIYLTKKMVSFSFFLIPNALMWWIINSMDRFMIIPMYGIDANGIYAVSSKVPAMLSIFTNIFNQAWLYSTVKNEQNDKKDSEKYTNYIYSIFFKTIMLVAIILVLIIKPLLNIYVGKSFYTAWIYSIPIIVGTAFSSLGTFISSEYNLHKDSRGFLKSATIGALINLILNYALMSILGVMGAAIATCISFISVFIFRAIDIRKYKKIKYIDRKKIPYIITLITTSISIYINCVFLNILTYTLISILVISYTKLIYKELKKKEA